MSSKNIAVFGSINQDFFNYVERFPSPGESVRGHDFQMANGGKGANQAVAAAKLGGDVTMIGMVGDDIFADSVLKNLKESGVNVDLVKKISNINTGCAVIIVDEKGENNIIITPGANDKMSPERAIEVEKQISKAKLVVCQAEIPEEANLEAFRIAKKHGVKTFLNPAPCNPNMNREILKFTDLLCVNETEAETILKRKISEHNDFKKAVRDLLELGPNIAIITLGKSGAILAHYGKEKKVELHEVKGSEAEVVDTTGAGDCFAGALAYLLVDQSDLSYKEMVAKAVKIASISVGRRGCQPSYPSINEVRKQGIL